MNELPRPLGFRARGTAKSLLVSAGDPFRKLIMPKHPHVRRPPESSTAVVPAKNQSAPGDLTRWEGEGGASTPPPALPKERPLKLTFVISGRASYDSTTRSTVEAIMNTPVGGAGFLFMSRQGQAQRNQERSRLQNSWRNAPSHPSDKHRGRRTMGRHGNRP
jgi:hypothetical protein